MHRSAPFLLLLTLSLAATPLLAETELTIASFNIWGAGRNDGQPLDRTTAAIRALDADIIGLQEVRGESSDCSATDCPAEPASLAPELARALGYEWMEQLTDNEVLWANAILSRHPIIGTTPNGLGARVEVEGRQVVLFNIHATDYPYQPFQLLGIPYGDAAFLHTAAEAVEAARAARQGALQLLLGDLAATAAADLYVITGDFNEPSHRDWTPAAVTAGLHPLAVEWPFTLAVEAAGFIDAFRTAHPDEVQRPGFTWSPLIPNDDAGQDHRDRIDYVFVRAPGLRVVSAAVAGEPGPWSDIVVDPWPSDHRAIVTRIRF